jgi:hypothetical protein
MPGTGADRLRAARSAFQARIDAAEDFALRCCRVRHATANRHGLTRAQVEWAAELSLLKLVLASERFFESTLALYALGATSPGGYRPRRRRKFDCSVVEVLDVFRGDQEFVGWNSPTVIIRRAERWLRHGEPYQTTLSSASLLLEYLKKMRNVVAHESESAFEKYANATRSLYGALPSRVCPGLQLVSPPPPAIPYLIGTSLLGGAIASYRLVARQIVL